jgi:dinuclear metal center YbgI/SA1388 family protein
MQRLELDTYLNQYLDVARFRDYCPNGLQVEGRAYVERIATGVTASVELLGAAIEAGADAIIVHQGYFWRGEDARIVGMRRRRIALLIEHNVSLYAFHLPLDAHPEIGNNASLASRLGFDAQGRFGEQDIGFYGEIAPAPTLGELAARIEQRLARKPLVIGDNTRLVRRIAWCTGAAHNYFEDAVRLGVDACLTGEVSEQTVHLARESGVAFIAAGRHVTERYGVHALGAHLARQFGIEHRHIEIPKPV